MLAKYRCGEIIRIRRAIAFKDELLGDVSVEKEIDVTIVGIKRRSDSEKVYYTYQVTNDPCQPYYQGGNIIEITEKDMIS